MLVVTGSTGRIGAQVARQLIDRDHEVRGLVRNASRADQVPGLELVGAAYSDVGAIVQAIDGADAVLMVSIIDTAESHLEQQADFVSAAAQADIGHLVYLSFVNADPASPLEWCRAHGETEQLLLDLDVPTTFLRSNYYAVSARGLIDHSGRVRAPVGDGRIAAVSRDDVAAAVAGVMTDPKRHRGQTYELSGPAALTLDEVMAAVSEADGYTAEYRPFTPAAYEDALRTEGVPAHLVEAWSLMFQSMGAGDFARVTDDVELLTGRPPMSVLDALRSDTD